MKKKNKSLKKHNQSLKDLIAGKTKQKPRSNIKTGKITRVKKK